MSDQLNTYIFIDDIGVRYRVDDVDSISAENKLKDYLCTKNPALKREDLHFYVYQEPAITWEILETGD